MANKRYRLNVDFDNTIVPFLYNGTGEWSFTVPAAPNFMSTRYVVFLPCTMVLNDPTKIPLISGYTRIENGIPDSGEFRTIEVDRYSTLLLKDAIEFNSADAGASLTITNLYTVGSTVSPDLGELYTEERRGFPIYTKKSTGVDSDLSTGILYKGAGSIFVNGVELLSEVEAAITIPLDLTASRWHIIYLDSAGNFTVEATTDSTYTQFPIAELDSKAPVIGSKLARYKLGDSDKRAVALAYSLPTPSAYAAGTTYVRRDIVEYSGTAYISRVDSNTGNTPSSSPTQWLSMGAVARIFSPKIYNLPIETFGTGELGDVTLDGTGLGATATPFYGTEEETASTPEEYPEYQFNNLTLTGTCYCGKSNGNALAPVIIRVKGTLTIESGGQLNGDARGANGGAGGAGAGTGGAGGAGAKSGRPIFIYANRIINKRTSGYWVTCVAGDASNGASLATLGGGGGGGAGSSSNLTIITNSRHSAIKGYNPTLNGKAGNGGELVSNRGAGAPGGGAGGEYKNGSQIGGARGGRSGVTAISGSNMLHGGDSGCKGDQGRNYGGTYLGGYGGEPGELGGGGGAGFHAGSSTQGGAGGAGGAGGGGGAYGANSGGAGSTARAGGGGSGADYYSNGQAGSAPSVSHEGLGLLLIIDNYSVRYGI